jgi:hypothetical protein
MHTYSIPDADLMQIKLVHCRILEDSMHTLHRAISVIQMQQLCHGGPQAAAGADPVRCPTASPRKVERQPGKAKRRPGQAKRRPGKAKRRPGKTKQGWRRQGMRSCTPVSDRRAPACGDGGAACVKDTIISFDTPPPPRLMMSTGRAWPGPGIGRDRSKQGGERFALRLA